MNLNEPIKLFDGLIDNRFGIINKVYEYNIHYRSEIFSYCKAYSCDTSYFCDQKNFRATQGVGITKERAFAKAVGEAIERYCSAIYCKNKLPFCSYKEVDFNSINPNEFLNYLPELYEQKNFPWKCFNEYTKIRWAHTIDLKNNIDIFAPAAYIYLPYIYGKAEDKIIQSISTGLACHSNYELAAITAICEVIERDSFMFFWRNKFSPPRIKLSTLPKYIRDILQSYRSFFQEITLFDITTDIKIPTVLACLRSTIPNAPGLIISASCKTSADLAILSAIEELELIYIHCTELNRDCNLKNTYKKIDKIKNQQDHLHFWINNKNHNLSNFLFLSHIEKDITQINTFKCKSPKEELNYIIDLLSNLNMKILLADLTTSDIAPYGYYVLRAIIPGLHPLTFGYKNDLFNCPRFKMVAKKLGLKNDPNLSNTHYVPHPFS